MDALCVMVSPKTGAASARAPRWLSEEDQALFFPDRSSGTVVLLGLSLDDCSYPGRWNWQIRNS